MPRMMSETHRIATMDEAGSFAIYLAPLLERIHRISPTTPMKHHVATDDEGAVLVTLEVGQTNYSKEEIIKSRAILERLGTVAENYISANKGSDGCVGCGAAPGAQCLSTCDVLDAELCLSSLHKVLGDD